MNHEVVTYESESCKARLEVTTATVRMGMKRARLRMEGQAWVKEQKNPDIDEVLLRQLTWPDMMAATTSYQVEAGGQVFSDQGQALIFEAYLELPDAFSTVWESAVYRQNPAWLPQDEGTDEKKDPQPPSTIG